MKQVRTTITTTFADYEEACRFIALYAGCDGGSLEYNALEKSVPGYAKIEDPQAALCEAIRIVAKYNGVTPVSDGVPTYISKRTGVAHVISDMPTRYLRNVAGQTDYGLAAGVRAALEAELRRRGERL